MFSLLILLSPYTSHRLCLNYDTMKPDNYYNVTQLSSQYIGYNIEY